MDFSDFTGEVQHRLELGTQGEAVRATRAVLSTLGERIQEGEATDLASPLPQEIDYYVVSVDHGQRFDHDEFVSRVAERAEVDEADAAFYGQALVALLAECVPGGGRSTTSKRASPTTTRTSSSSSTPSRRRGPNPDGSLDLHSRFRISRCGIPASSNSSLVTS